MAVELGYRRGPAYEFGDEYRSSILADPSLQYPKDRIVDEIHDKVEEVVEIKKDNFNFKKDKTLSYLMAAAVAALVGLALFAIIALHSTGVGAGILAIATFVALVAGYTHNVGKSKEENIVKVNNAFRDASRQRIGRTVDNNQKMEEQGIELQPVRGRRRAEGRYEPRPPAYNPAYNGRDVATNW